MTPVSEPTPEPTDHVEPEFIPSAEFSVAEGRRDVGLCFVGASVTAGYGDPKGLGWVGRVVSRTQHPDLDLTAYNLGVRGDTSAGVMGRWRARFVDRLFVGHGVLDPWARMGRVREMYRVRRDATLSAVSCPRHTVTGCKGARGHRRTPHTREDTSW